MRLAILSDIHGNLIALDAVLAAIERVRYPRGAFITRFMRGEARPPWSIGWQSDQ